MRLTEDALTVLVLGYHLGTKDAKIQNPKTKILEKIVHSGQTFTSSCLMMLQCWPAFLLIQKNRVHIHAPGGRGGPAVSGMRKLASIGINHPQFATKRSIPSHKSAHRLYETAPAVLHSPILANSA